MRALPRLNVTCYFFISAVLSWVCVSAFDGCRIRYGRRGCYDKLHTGVLVTCDGSGEFYELPAAIPSDTVYLSLINFKFDRLSRDNFTQLRAVECMNIMDSGISGIAYDTFSDMEHLHELEIQNADINNHDLAFISHPDFRAKLVTVTGTSSIARMDFNGSAALQKFKLLNLEMNGLRFVHPSILYQLTALETLKLSDNQLQTVDWRSFSNLVHLNKLELNGNRLQTIPEYVSTLFSAVKQLKLADNPFHCNCKLRWLKEYYETTDDKLLDYDAVYCNSPFNKPMIDTFVEEFACDKPSKPLITWIQINTYEYIVNCTSLSDPAPTITLTFPDSRQLVTPPFKDLSILNTTTPRIITEAGEIICEASNSQGATATVEVIPLDPSLIAGCNSCTSSWTTLMMTLLLCLLLQRAITKS